MRNSMIRSAAIFFLLAMLAAPTAYACSCVPPGPPSEALAQADVVAAVEVLGIDRTTEADYPLLRVQTRVIRGFKGADSDRLALYTATNSAACGFNFEEGQRYLVYASDHDGTLSTGLCTRTAALADAEEDLEAFNARDVLGHEASRGGCGGVDNFAALQAVFFIGIGLAWRRRRQRGAGLGEAAGRRG